MSRVLYELEVGEAVEERDNRLFLLRRNRPRTDEFALVG